MFPNYFYCHPVGKSTWHRPARFVYFASRSVVFRCLTHLQCKLPAIYSRQKLVSSSADITPKPPCGRHQSLWISPVLSTRRNPTSQQNYSYHRAFSVHAKSICIHFCRTAKQCCHDFTAPTAGIFNFLSAQNSRKKSAACCNDRLHDAATRPLYWLVFCCFDDFYIAGS